MPKEKRMKEFLLLFLDTNSMPIFLLLNKNKFYFGMKNVSIEFNFKVKENSKK